MTTHERRTSEDVEFSAAVDNPSAPGTSETTSDVPPAQGQPTSGMTRDVPPAQGQPTSGMASDMPPAQGQPTSGMTSDVPPAQGQPTTMGDDSSTVRTDAPEMDTGSSTASTEPPADEPLFADGTLSGLRSRWDDVQAAFVDDPKECVQKADALVAQVVDGLTTGFTEARSRLEAQWAKGEEASTEDLRLALKRYREFFQRLLSV
jgi:hypothetical protein